LDNTANDAKVSVIVLNWNGRRFLDSCLTSLTDQSLPTHEVVLVDNGSNDGSVQYVRDHFPRVKIAENGANLGFAEGNNIGIRLATGDYVVLLNNDTSVPSNFIEVLANCARVDPKIGSVGCTIVQEDGIPRYGPAFTNNGFLTPLLIGSNLLRKRIERLFDVEGYCLTNCAAAVLYRKNALQVTGGFDADFWADWEDHDLGFRLWLAGFKNYYTTKTHVMHVGGGSFGREISKDRQARIIRNMLVTYLKNYDSWNLVTRFFFLLWVIVPLRHLASIILYELTRLKTSHRQGASLISREAYLALPLAYLAFIRDLPRAMRKRMKVQAQRKVSDSIIFSLTERKWIV
jgi:GT2 family glycosyltransferase